MPCPPATEVIPNCSDDEKIVIGSNNFCGIITNPNGPFKDCHNVIDPVAYFNSCAYDLCELNLDQASLCDSLQSYAVACQSQGVTIQPWRNDTFCPIDCLPNSHYEICSTACPATCVNPGAPSKCDLPCVEGCFCDPGYVLYNDKCVPSLQCGCWDGNNYYPVGSEFWNDDCSTKCRCPSPGSALVCNAATCDSNQYCATINNVSDCIHYKYGICRVNNDPHYNSFDRPVHRFMGLCTYTLSKLCSNSSNLPSFNVEAKNEHRGNPSVTFVQKVIVEVYGYRIQIVRKETSRVLVDGVWVILPVILKGGSITVRKSGRYIALETDFKLQVSYDTDHSVEVKIPDTYSNQLCGMCGNFNGQQQDEFLMPNGQQAQNSNELGNSWLVYDEEDPFCSSSPTVAPPRICPPEKEQVYQSDAYCGLLTSINSIFSICHSAVDPANYFETCVFDLCALDGDKKVLCSALEVYADACQQEGITIPGWRNITSCELSTCPPNTTYNGCMTACPATCVDPYAPEKCNKPCMEGCECNPGHVISGDICVDASNCGCLYDDKYYNKGDSFLEKDCERKCECQGNNNMVCNETSCAEDEICKVQNGSLGCYPGNEPSAKPVTIRTTTPTAPIDPCDYTCSFGMDYCGWQQSKLHNLDWIRWYGPTPSDSTGPSSDHSGDGYYLYVDGRDTQWDDRAWLESTECEVQGPNCLSFWYHMYGALEESELNVFVLTKYGLENVASFNEDGGDVWHFHQIELRNNEKIQIIFEGVLRQEDSPFDIAIDDISFVKGYCTAPQPPITTTTGPSLPPDSSPTATAQPSTTSLTTPTDGPTSYTTPEPGSSAGPLTPDPVTHTSTGPETNKTPDTTTPEPGSSAGPLTPDPVTYTSTGPETNKTPDTTTSEPGSSAGPLTPDHVTHTSTGPETNKTPDTTTPEHGSSAGPLTPDPVTHTSTGPETNKTPDTTTPEPGSSAGPLTPDPVTDTSTGPETNKTPDTTTPEPGSSAGPLTPDHVTDTSTGPETNKTPDTTTPEPGSSAGPLTPDPVTDTSTGPETNKTPDTTTPEHGSSAGPLTPDPVTHTSAGPETNKTPDTTTPEPGSSARPLTPDPVTNTSTGPETNKTPDTTTPEPGNSAGPLTPDPVTDTSTGPETNKTPDTTTPEHGSSAGPLTPDPVTDTSTGPETNKTPDTTTPEHGSSAGPLTPDPVTDTSAGPETNKTPDTTTPEPGSSAGPLTPDPVTHTSAGPETNKTPDTTTPEPGSSAGPLTPAPVTDTSTGPDTNKTPATTTPEPGSSAGPLTPDPVTDTSTGPETNKTPDTTTPEPGSSAGPLTPDPVTDTSAGPETNKTPDTTTPEPGSSAEPLTPDPVTDTSTGPETNKTPDLPKTSPGPETASSLSPEPGTVTDKTAGPVSPGPITKSTPEPVTDLTPEPETPTPVTDITTAPVSDVTGSPVTDITEGQVTGSIPGSVITRTPSPETASDKVTSTVLDTTVSVTVNTPPGCVTGITESPPANGTAPVTDNTGSPGTDGTPGPATDSTPDIIITSTSAKTTTPAVPPTVPPHDPGYCEVSGDPHYYTFDKQIHHFMGVCTYTLSKLCANDSNLTDFNVEAANDLRNGLTHVSYVQFVNVDVYGYRITLEKVRKVKVNGQPVTLPVSLPPDVEIFLSGTSVFVTTGFGLQVSYDGSHKATVTLPGEYWDKVCGLCGNFNGDKADDFLNPDGNLESDSNSLGNSWQVENDTVCPPAVGNKTNCTEDENDIISSNSYCGIITNVNGPFKECHHVIDPRVYFENCVYDLCEVKLDNGTLCHSLQSYADACQSHGVIIQPWRNDTFCPLTCPPNSHYEPCGTSCPSTCVNPHAPNNCSRPCAEGCFCDPGYVLYDTKCVPEDQCGCWQDDKYYPVGDEFWSDDTCSSKCRCPSAGSALVCTEESCLDNQYCGVTNGIPGCYNKPNPGYCEVSGDPHYYTFDKQIHHFMGVCTYTLSKLCANDSNLTDFNVEAANDLRNGLIHVSYVQFVNVDVYGYRITLEKVRKVKVNGQPVTLPESLPPDVEIFLSGTNVFVTTGFGLQVSYDGSHKATVSLPAEYANNVCGLCGNFNGDKADDFLNPDGNLEPNSTSLGNSWQVENDTVCPPTDGNNGTCTEDEKIVISSNSYCGMITNENGPFKECHHVVDPEVYFENCVYDLCEVKLDNGTLCDSLQSYADVCQSHGVTVELWRNETFCPLECPQNSHYEPCGTSCPSTCVNPNAPNNCNRPCAEGCFCDPGYVLYNNICVPKDQCGCWQDDKYYPVGDEFWSDDTCSLKCRCPSAGSALVCTEESCLDNQYCGVPNGVPECYDKPDSGYCEVSGDPHYYTFDKQVHHFMGLCTYTLSKLCKNDVNLTDFNVEAANDLRNGLTHVSYVQFVNVDVYEYRITLEKVRKVKVNGQPVTLPVSLPPDVEIFLSGTSVFVTTGFGLQVSYDGSHKATVTLPGEYWDNVCGLCGNFNGDKVDDFLNPDGNLESDSNSLGNSWQVENDTVCPPAVGNKTNCTEDVNDIISSNSYCGIITNVNGPFKECHHVVDPEVYFESCVYDLCEVKLDKGTLCDSLQSYADACQSHGVIIQPWRNDTFCPLKCPPNSHYEPCGTSCPSTCVNPHAPNNCSRPCAEGCFCDPGYVLYDTKCVPEVQCGCWQDDKHYPVGDVFWSDDTCSLKCSCPSPGSALVCTEESCLDNQYCGVTNGIPGCYNKPNPGYCEVSGDPHYYTFDKQIHHFMGICTYTLSKLCANDSNLTDFTVEAANDIRNGWTEVSYVQFVNVDVYEYRITLEKVRKVKVNGQPVTPPVSLHPDVEIFLSGTSVFVTTGFGLQVSYDGSHKATVSLPGEYANNVCGLCGNFNGDKADDFLNPDGNLEPNSTSLGNSWQVENDTVCPPTDGNNGTCTEDEKIVISSNSYCGMITNENGPFKECHHVVDPEVYFENCVYDLCEVKLDNGTLCDSLQSYADVCQSHGVTVELWRNETFCPLECPQNSHYEPCGTGCQSTCVNPHAPNNCNRPCAEGCFCDPGYVLYDNICVPKDQCGCWQDDKYYPVGDEFWSDDTCTLKCRCPSAGSGLVCTEESCLENQNCGVINGVPGCYEPGYCEVSGDPHYYTFDKQVHHFMGVCTYTLSKLCTTDANLTDFTVEAANDLRNGLTHVSYVQFVNVHVYGYRITLEKVRKVKVNGQQVTLPVSLPPDVEIFLSGTNVFVTTGFGLQVSYDGSHRATVTIPGEYYNSVCGLCGNFNGDKADDFLNPDGNLESDSNSLGNSWQVENDTVCPPAVENKTNCTEDENHLISSNTYCGIITNVNGPFKECHHVIDPRVYFENCVYDLCEVKLDNGTLCDSLQSYADACQSHGVTVQPWRNDTFCPLKCPPNSHYEPCGTGCPSTCVNKEAPSKCSRPCAEGCFCDPGYVLYDTKCVPKDQCGCWQDDKYYPVGDEFWSDDTCSSKCRCPSEGSGLVCTEDACPGNQYCGISNGVPGCYYYTFGICRVHNDPHYDTFDKQNHNFMGLCTYTLAKLCDSSSSLPYFNVEAKNQHRGEPSVSFVEWVIIEVYGQHIQIMRNEQNRVLVNKIWTTLPVSLVGGLVTVTWTGKQVNLETDFRLTVSYDTDTDIDVKVPSTYSSLTCGICGNFNNRKKDDFMMPNGQQALTSEELGHSWIAYDEDPLCHPDDPVPPPPPDCTPEKYELYKSDGFCGLLTSKDGPFYTCNSVISPGGFFESCIFDLCALDGDKDILCSLLGSYAAACQKEGLTLNWRNSTGCEPTCQNHSHFNPCMSACPATCLNLAPTDNCSLPCTEGCECDDGYVLSGGTCVHESSCGCLYNGTYYSEGEIFVQGNCENSCTCKGNNNMECHSISCAKDEICKVQNGTMGCYAPSTAICHIYGDPHYYTFDGTLHHFQGSCNYTVTETCENTSNNFIVTTRNEHRGNPDWTAINSVALTVDGLHILLEKNNMVLINGTSVTLPVTVSGISIVQNGQYVKVTADFGLELEFNGDHELFVKVKENYKGTLCGLCGTYNENRNDDFMTPNGTVVSDVNEFGSSWRVPDDNWICDDTPPSPPTCSPPLLQEAQNRCWILKQIDGPFRSCYSYIQPHGYFESCVFDQCVTGGSNEQLCNVLASYAAICESKGVSLEDWKNNTICDPTITTTTATTTGVTTTTATTTGVTTTTATTPGPTTRTPATTTGYISSDASCSASGDPHYNTFDGAVHHYMGNCSYTLSKPCNASSAGLPDFHVYTTNEHRDSNTKVSYVQSVHIEISEDEFTILKNKKFNINGRRSNLPMAIKNSYSAYINGNYLVFETDFGLRVRFDGNHYVDISLPSIYKGHLCGLCGNYNGISGDDNVKKDGSMATDTKDLGDSWIVSSNETQCGSQDLDVCDPLLREEYSRNTACGIIKDNTGIFKNCHALVNPDNFFENCVLDMCFTESKSTSLCYAVQAYAQQCANAGVCTEWRSATFCPLSCPGGSHYQTCGTGCPATCHNLLSETECKASTVEGCFCDEGYVLSGDRCVKESECGCTDSENNSYQLGESWFANDDCSERCTCNQNNAISCTPWKCGVLEKCESKDGVLGCQSSGRASCHVSGDPHFYTFDKVMHSFMGTCTYTILQVCDPQNVIPVTISGKTEERGQRAASYLKEVYIDIYGIRITLQKARKMMVENQQIQTPWSEHVRGVSIGTVGLYSVVETDFGLIAKFDGDHYLEIILPESYFGKVCGMCGNYNGRQDDEYLLPNGLQAINVTHFGNSWKSEKDSDKNCVDDGRQDLGPPCKAAQLPAIENQCNALLSDTFKPCHHLIDPQPFVKSCVYDMCRYNGMQSTLCAIVQGYVGVCMTHGVKLKWRSNKLCPLSCPSHSHYTDCASLCPATCNDIYASAVCDKPEACTEGCVCNDGYVLSGDKCVSLKKCGCRDSKNNYFNVDETWLTSNCKEVCSCNGAGKIICKPHGCSHGKCGLNNGKYNCKPTGYAKCHITGDPHHKTFDRLTHHFQGKESYVLTQTSSVLPDLLQPFSIEGKNEPMNKYSKFTLIREMRIKVYNHTIIFSQKKKLVLDGVKTSPPIKLKEGIHIYQRPSRIYLETDFGMSVSFDGNQNAEITVPNTHKNVLEGLCGNYDGRSSNDFRRPDGSQVRDVVSFGESWKVKSSKSDSRIRRDIGLREEEDILDLDTGDNLACSASELAHLNSTSFCGMLRDTNGPFETCHALVDPEVYITNCLFDTCAEFRNMELFCSNLEQYSLACQDNGTTLDGWREKAGCDLPCAPNSEYSKCMSACPASCSNMASEAECEAPCYEGCKCSEGYILSDFECVPYKECGCTYLDKYYQYGEVFMTDDCTQNCTCTDTVSVVCSNIQCESNEICAAANGIRGCYIPGPCLENPCENGGTCVEGTMNSTSMYCVCPESYSGEFCEAEEKKYDNSIIYIVIGVVVGVLVIGFFFVFAAFCFFRNQGSKKHLLESQSSEDGSVSLSRISVNPGDTSIYNEPDLTNLAFEEDFPQSGAMKVTNNTNVKTSDKRTSEQKSADNAKASEQTTTRHNQTQF
ncbi:IgGFc-binding protein-like [Xenopus laevis]|uniref:IgGFc-binding protein-like n=1 Tax=Xenopus laevis TaxID=8355 RepID=A0A8J1KQY6_XENLA|nr:IgGFc-binding protein-like [Xenopus laevis]